MTNNIPPPGSPPPSSQPPSNLNPSSPTPPPGGGGGAGESMTDFMKLFTPEQRKKFMNILTQSLVQEINKASKKYIAELRKERAQIEGDDSS